MSVTRRLPFAVLCLVWAGIVIGLSFIEPLVRFSVAGVPRLINFELGRHVFAASQWVQACCAGLAIGAALVGRAPRWAWVCLALAVCALLIQMGFLFPVLNARAQTLIDGGVPSGYNPHTAYGVLEVLKVLFLVAGPVQALRTSRPGAAG